MPASASQTWSIKILTFLFYLQCQQILNKLNNFSNHVLGFEYIFMYHFFSIILDSL